jgi:very-short-patch-repair endonuclease
MLRRTAMNRDQEKTIQTIITGQKPGGKLSLAEQMRREPTPAEAKLWFHLRAGRLNGLHFRRQQVIDGFIVDFYCHAAGLVVELDGSVHRLQADYDAERDWILEERGLCILRFSNSQVEIDCPIVLAHIMEALG